MDVLDSTPALRTLFENIAKKVNTYIKDSWQEYGKEYSSVRVCLQLNDKSIDLYIKDKESSFGFEKRSDGFKRFISFLFTIAMPLEYETTNRQTMLLIDEPETGLHPSAAKDLHYKLKKLAKKIPVIYATHSISMVDTETIENNLAIKKINENTIKDIEKQKEDGKHPANLIYQALGFSIYEMLRPKNIIFEGYYDKKLFNMLIENNDDNKTYWNDIGICFMNGLKNIKNIISFLELAKCKYIIVLDSDRPANEGKKEFQEKYGEHKALCFTYEDLGLVHITGEDFLQNDFIKEQIEILQQNENFELDVKTLDITENDKLENIKKAIKTNNNTISNNTKNIIKLLKEQLWENCKIENIQTDKVQQALEKIKEKLETL